MEEIKMKIYKKYINIEKKGRAKVVTYNDYVNDEIYCGTYIDSFSDKEIRDLELIELKARFE